MTDGTISEKCETLYNKLNSFVCKVINRDVQPQINNLESDVNSLDTSITNLADTTSWTYYINNDQYKVRYNKYRVNVDVSIMGTSATTNFTRYGSSIIPNELRPKLPVSAFDHNANTLVQIKDNDTKLYRKSATGTNLSNINIYAHLEWDRR